MRKGSRLPSRTSRTGGKLVISATARGRELMLRARQRRVQALAELIAGIGENEQEQLA